MIDYQAVGGGAPLGFAYDDVPFECEPCGRMTRWTSTEYRKRYEAQLAEGRRSRPAERARRAAAAAERRERGRAREGDRTLPRSRRTTSPSRWRSFSPRLRNREEPVAVRMAALQALAALDFLGPRFAPFRADYKQALRDVATDPEPELRESALELLAIDKDPYAQELLVRG